MPLASALDADHGRAVGLITDGVREDFAKDPQQIVLAHLYGRQLLGELEAHRILRRRLFRRSNRIRENASAKYRFPAVRSRNVRLIFQSFREGGYLLLGGR